MFIGYKYFVQMMYNFVLRCN